MSDLKIPGFEMIERVGQGGMATVWKARQISLDRIVAIKILSAQLAHDPTDVQRFQAEAQQAAKLKHPAIIQVYDANAEQGVYYFVMEYVAGYTVGDWVRRKGVLSEKDAILVAECVTDALDYAWQNARIIHCDIKPDNVMVDADGTVKLADLGLSRTINAMSSKKAEEDVMGTPAYISPEQATGDPDLDCRADIYSLGAMLYHLVTGKLLFEGHPDERIMEMQVTDTVPDAIDLNPKVSKNLCAMIEKMLAKNKADRHADWAAVRADIARVKKGLPIIHPPAEGLSTVSRSTKRMKVVSSHVPAANDEIKGVSVQAKIAVAAVVLVVLGAAAALVIADKRAKARPPPRLPPATIPLTTGAPQGLVSEDEARGFFESAQKWMEANPEKFDEGITRFQRVIVQTRGTSFAGQAEGEIHRLSEAKQGEIDKIMKQLADDTAAMIREERFVDAAAKYEGYTGKMASDTDRKRKLIAAELRASKDRAEEARRKKELLIETKMSDLLDKIVTDLTTVGVEPALMKVGEATGDEDLSRKQEALRTIKRLLEGAAATDQKILDGFKACRGQEIQVQLSDGAKKMTIMEVRDGKVTGQQKIDSGGATAGVNVTFEVKDLSAKERLLRMGSEEAQPDVALMKGLMALNSKAYPHAKKYFGMTHPLLSDRLIACVEATEKRQAGDDAKSALVPTLRMMGVPAEPSTVEAWVDAVTQKKIPNDVAPRVLDSLAAFRAKYGATEFAKEADALLQAIEKGCQVAEPVRNMPPVKAPPLSPKLAEMVGDSQAIVDYLLDRNPDLSSKEVTLAPVPPGATAGVTILADGLADIGPLAAFRDLKDLACSAPEGHRCKLSDLSPVRGLPLESLYVGFASVRDLIPLRGMPLKKLRIRDCPITDLAPLKDMFTLEELQVRATEIKDVGALRGLKIKRLDIGASTRVFDIRPLMGMALESLNISETQVKDLAVIKDMPLRNLNLSKTRIFNFSILKGMTLTSLNLDDTQFKDLSLLKGLPLKELHLSNLSFSDITPLRGFTLTEVSLSGSLAKDYSALADMPIHSLTLSGSRVEDLEFAKDMPLTYVDISNTKISDLSPLKDKKITYLYINGTRVKDLRPLSEMPLTHLSCQNTSLNSFEPLRRLPLYSIVVDEPDGAVRPVLRTMPNLQYVNGVYQKR